MLQFILALTCFYSMSNAQRSGANERQMLSGKYHPMVAPLEMLVIVCPILFYVELKCNFSESSNVQKIFW